MPKQMRRLAPMKAPIQALITADKGITDLAPDREGVSLGV